MNTYSKFCPNVFLAKCPEKHEKGESILVETKYGKENESIVFNLIYERDGFYFGREQWIKISFNQRVQSIFTQTNIYI